MRTLLSRLLERLSRRTPHGAASRRGGLLVAALPLALNVACGPDATTPARPPIVETWLARAKASYHAGDMEDAGLAVQNALKAAPRDAEARVLAARIALARLEFDNALKLTEGIDSSEVHAIRGRAHWYAGDVEPAADELEAALGDPNMKDKWARDIATLARRGHGRHPFAIEGGIVAAVEMPPAGPRLVVPCELEGERILAVVATSFGELMVDSSTRKEPAWVNLRFGDSIEVKDVPALTFDLSAISRQLGAPIRALIGVNVLRHMHVTIDRRGSQFVVRKEDPPAPPAASRVPLFYVKGGGMMMRASVSAKDEGQTSMFVDSSAAYPLALDEAVLKRSGADLSSFRPEPGTPPSWRLGMLPYFKLGGLDLPQIPAMRGPSIADYKQNMDVELGGVVGAGLLAAFRITLGDDGRYMWMEMDPLLMQMQDPGPAGGAPPGEPAEGVSPGPPTGGAPAPAPTSIAPPALTLAPSGTKPPPPPPKAPAGAPKKPTGKGAAK
ncbi:MAG: hypothetical protein R3B36_15500 [Polyangiaceae bacterium]